MAEEELAGPELRRSARLALCEIYMNERVHETPKHVNADEMVIIQRGPRRKNIIWSPEPVQRSPRTTPELPPDEDKTAAQVHKRPSLNARTRRRLIMSPSKDNHDGVIARKLRVLPKMHQKFGE